MKEYKEYNVVADNMEIKTFERMFSIDRLDLAEGSVTLSSRGHLSFHRWTPLQLKRLSECALFLARRLEGVHSSDCAIYNLPALPSRPCDCGVGPYTLIPLTKEQNAQG